VDSEAMLPIKRMLADGRFADAQKAIEKELLREPGEPLLLAHLAAIRMEVGEVDQSRQDLAAASTRAAETGHTEAQAFAELWLGYLSNRQNRPEDAVRHFETAAALEEPSADLCGVLCQTYNRIGQPAKAKLWGARSLRMRAFEVNVPDSMKVSGTRPRPFDPARRQRNVIAFSLFGQDPYYYDCALTVARSAQGIFPEFVCWFYCSQDIPQSLMQALGRTGTKVMTVAGKENSTQHPFSPLLWRFLPFDDKEVDVVLVRDVDSPFTLRERAAIDLWLASDAPFLTIRDSVQHTEPLMAGMWGGFTGLLPPLAPTIARFKPQGSSRYIDQMFLRHFIWPRIRDSTLAIDSVYSLGRSVDFPAEVDRPGSLSVGSAWPRNRIHNWIKN
jgi:tetratricopeptide (TPR) repeat protein